MKADRSQKGSALFIILIGVMLFASLGYAVSQMMRGGNPDMISGEQAKLHGNEILNYARSMRQSTQNMKISNGCTDLDISFETDDLTGYGHTPAAGDACKLFQNVGGGIVYQAPVEDWLDLSAGSAPPLRGHWYFPGDVCAVGTGTATTGCNRDSVDNEAVIAVLPYLKKSICVELNRQLGVGTAGANPPVETGNGWKSTSDKFTGDQSDGEKLEQGGIMAGCFEGASGSTPGPKTYHFFQILIPR